MSALAERAVDSDVVLDARDVRMVFSEKGEKPVTALAGITVSARAGRVTGFVGPDGAGKTTLLRIAAGLLTPTAGHMSVLGFDAATEIDPIRRRVGYMPQQFGLYEDLTVQENLELYADLRGVAPRRRPDRYERLMRMTGLGPFTGRRAGHLSGGMQQKLGLACCLVETPRLLILDEPTVGIDPVSRRELWEIVYELVEDDGIGVVLSTAYLDEAERCHHVALLDEGEVLDQGPPARFHERVRDRVYLVTPVEGKEARRVQSVLARRADVVGAAIRSGRIRTVLATAKAASDLPGEYCAAVSAAEPLFEDAFVDAFAARIATHRVSESAPRPGGRDEAARGSEIVVRVDGLMKKFGDFTAVEDIGFEVRRGEVFGLLGPNGAGKTTTFRMLCGLLPASGGEIDVAGHDLRRSPAAARSRLGYMAQKFSMYQQLSVVHNLRFYGKAYGLRGRRLRERVDWALEEFGLQERRRLAAGSLPGGYRQRLAMAAAMLHEPDILFLDEPTSGADPLARREFWLRINGFAQNGVTIVVTTHFMEEAEFCDHMVIMSDGTMLAEGTPAQIRALVRTSELTEPTIEDAFIALAEGRVSPAAKRAVDD